MIVHLLYYVIGAATGFTAGVVAVTVYLAQTSEGGAHR